MKVHGRARVQDFLGTFIVYRSLLPMDKRLPALPKLREELSIPLGLTPRKSSTKYADVIARIIRHAQDVRGENDEIEHLLYIGDTRVNDGTAFANLLTSGDWTGAAFIASESEGPEKTRVEGPDGRKVLVANRWKALDSYDCFCRDNGFDINEQTAVVIDLDKTTLGARGRNDRVIDKVRLQAMRKTIAGLLDGDFDEQSFESDYSRLNQPCYHKFTTDNQDYLAYICLSLQSGVMTSSFLFEALDEGKIQHFAQFLALVDEGQNKLSPLLRNVHCSVKEALSKGNPTPFVDFRINEYLLTVKSMGCLPDQTPIDQLLKEEIVITNEVMQTALRYRDRGALLLGLSDKPDEASLPPPESESYLPVHQMYTHVVGGD
jgi:hypothetical protein